MSASDQMRKMLDELMGTQRDGMVEQDVLKFTSPSVCKSYLMGLCPFDLFHNTNSFKSSKKLDLGACSKIHDPALKADYEIAAKEHDYDYEVEQLDKLSRFIGDCDRKVTVNKRRIEETQDAETLGPEALAVHELNEQIGIKLAEAEELGADGKVEESMKIMAQVDDLKQQKRKAEDIYRQSVPATANQQQKLRVCEVCAAFLSLYDNDRRLADHFGGRLHMGFVKVRERLRDLEILVSKKREAREMERHKRRDGRERDRGDDWRDSRNDRDRNDGDNGRNRDREQRGRDKDRERERDADKDRERRNKLEQERERDRNRNRERSRERERERDIRGKSGHTRSPSPSRDNRRHPSNQSRTRSRSRERSRQDSQERSRRGSNRVSSPDHDRRKSEKSRSQSRDKSSPDGDSIEEGEVEDAADEQETWKISPEAGNEA